MVSCVSTVVANQSPGRGLAVMVNDLLSTLLIDSVPLSCNAKRRVTTHIYSIMSKMLCGSTVFPSIVVVFGEDVIQMIFHNVEFVIHQFSFII